MTFRPACMLALAFAVTGAATVHAASPEPRPRAPLLRGGECLDPDFARGFANLGDHVLLVDTGRHAYRIEVSRSCWNLRFTPFVTFRGDPVSNRVCGTAFDAIIPRGGIPCRIERLELLSREQYRQALAQDAAERRAARARRKAGKD
jgi:hypothetical protein